MLLPESDSILERALTATLIGNRRPFEEEVIIALKSVIDR